MELTKTSAKNYYWIIVSPFYWLCSLWVLKHRVPVHFDGAGPMATFYWGKHYPAVSLAQYFASSQMRRQFMYPYLIAAAIATLLGCGLVGAIVHSLHPKHSRLFPVSFAACFVVLFCVAGVSDIGTSLNLWSGPLLWRAPFLLSSIIVPLSAISGLLGLVEDRWSRLSSLKTGDRPDVSVVT